MMIICIMERKLEGRFAKKVRNHTANHVSFFLNYAVFWMELHYFKKLNMMTIKGSKFIKLIFQRAHLMKLSNTTHKC